MRKFEHLLKHKGNHIHTKEDCRIRRGAFISTQYPRRRDGVNDSISKNNGVGGWDGGGETEVNLQAVEKEVKLVLPSVSFSDHKAKYSSDWKV